MIIGFKQSAAQKADMAALSADLKNSRSANFRRWLTPETYGDRFGLAQEDVNTIDSWLRSHGFTIDHHARGRNWIGFSGTAAQVKAAFGAALHRYNTHGEPHYANSAEISIPQALAPVIESVIGLDDFHPKAHYNNGDGTHSLAPDDLATIYDIAPLYNNGITGTGINIAVLGESELEARYTDIRNFRAKFNLPASTPQVVLYGANPGITGALPEADLDLEWTGAIARNATLIYVYASDAEVARIYAVDQNLAPVVTSSYGGCETERAYLAVMLESVVQQGNAQGMTFVNASGDAGPAGCDDQFYSPAASNGAFVQFPSSIPEITAVGGTEFNEGSQSFWSTTNGPNGGSATGYIPEKAWNDTGLLGAIAASAGGASVLYAKPAWQAGPNVPNDGARDTPDVAMAASPFHDPYVVCTEGTCATDGGTSAAAPVFAGIVALLNQSLVSRAILAQAGLGNINPDLYQLAAAGSNAFHDITTGDNLVPCVPGTPDCSTGTLGFVAAPGYDQATGLGSVDVANLVNAWNSVGSQTSMTVSADKTTATMSDTITLTITVASASGVAPTGTIVANQSGVTIPFGTQPGEILLGNATLVPGTGQSTATLTIYPGQLAPGSDTISVVYGGDSNVNGSSASVTATVTAPSGHSAVSAVAYNNYFEYQYPPVFASTLSGGGTGWVFSLLLTEHAGVATTLTTLKISGTVSGTVDDSSLIVSSFGTNLLPADGSLTVLRSFLIEVPSAPATVMVTIGGQDASGYQWTTEIPVPLVAGPEQAVDVSSGGGLVNAASYENAYAPGMILGIFGRDLTAQSPWTAQAQSIPLPTSLLGASVTINGVPAPYYYASLNFATVQIPYEISPGLAVLTVTGWTGETFNYAFNVAAAAPGIFTDPSNPGAVVPYESGSPGQTVALYITGEGLVTPALSTGTTPAATTPLAQLPAPVLPVTVSVGGENAAVAFIGIVPGLVGATQINYTLPAQIGLGRQPVVVTVGGIQSPPAYITIVN